MGNFENELVHAFNDLSADLNVPAVAYRLKQAKYTGQYCDVLVDSANPRLYVAVENKSIRRSNRKKLYFSQHFSEKAGKHQVEHFTEYLEKSGRRGFLALEVRYGRGKPKRAFLIPWETVQNTYEQGEAGLSIQEIEGMGESVELRRNAHKYALPKQLFV